MSLCVLKYKDSVYRLLCCFIIMTVGLIVTTSISGINSVSATDASLSDFQKMTQEVAMAYYRRGDLVQYSSSRRSEWSAPEQMTSQSASDFVCSSYTFSIYYEALGIRTPESPTRLHYYAEKYYDQTDSEENYPDLVFYEKNASGVYSNSASRTEFKQRLLLEGENSVLRDDSALQVGDIIGYGKSSNPGHVFYIYDFVYDDEGKKIDAIVLHSNAAYYPDVSKVTRGGLSWRSELNDETGVVEGTVFYTLLSRMTNMWQEYLIVYRPTALYDKTGEQKYNRITNCDEASPCSASVKDFTINPSSSQRLSYPGMDIEKTVDVFNNSVVEPGDTLTYIVKITNNSNNQAFSDMPVTYTNIETVDYIQADLLEGPDGKTTINHTISAIQPGETYTYTYKVKIKKDLSIIGSKIESTGTVAGIPSAEVINYIGNNLNYEEKNQIKTAYQNLKENYSGTELMDKIYQQALGKDIKISDLILGAHYAGATTYASVCNPYYVGTDVNDNTVDALIKTTNSVRPSGIGLNSDNKYAKILLGSYYSALYADYTNSTCSYKNNVEKWFELFVASSPETAQISDRRRRVFPENLQTGDVLIYENAGSTGNPDPKTNEKGTYSFIWIEKEDGSGGDFYGANLLADDTALNKIEGVNSPIKDSLFTLYGKDYYAILRPSLAFEMSEDEMSDGDDINDNEINKDGDEDIGVPNTGGLRNGNDGKSNGQSLFGLVILIIVLVVTMSEFHRFMVRRRIQFKNCEKN